MATAAFLLLRIQDAGPCQAWLREILKGELTTAAEIPSERLERRTACLNVAFTWHGLKALGLDEDALQTFPYEFRKGMAARAHVLGDTGSSAPGHWEFGGTRSGGPRDEDIHVLLMLYARNEDELNTRLARQRTLLAKAGVQELYCQRAAHPRDKDGRITFREPFGFQDGVSQPVIQGFRKPGRHPEDYDSPIATGEFILGHDNEYQEKPLSPTVRASRDALGRLNAAELAERKDLGLNGSYLVLRKLQQDVDAFNAFVEKKSKEFTDGGPQDDEKKKEWLKAKLMGRWSNGAPLKPGQLEAPEPGPHGHSNAFNYSQEDAAGLGCPVTSHIRRANPRDSLEPEPELSRQVSRRHRILRRGIPYRRESRTENASPEQGLIFIALNAQLGRQFEFIQQSWLHNEKFERLYDERDPVSSNQESGMMTIPMKPLRRCVTDIQSFVTMKGGGYFFMPGVSALEFLAHLEPTMG
ncbi:Dyp-type peroxidase [Cystobacter fuscus]|uniref:Dyp-type peroxidase n=1 Tax=Cystobacter fuscus TaxID=43 RepID=UPI0037BF9BEF